MIKAPSPIISFEAPDLTWIWQGHDITYQKCGDSGPAVVLIHGFGASWRHWRKNIAILGASCRCYGLDLIGFGGSAKPQPSPDMSYTFDTWAKQVADFCHGVVGGPAFLVGNSIGSIVAMQTAVSYPSKVLGVAALNCSLRLLHERKRSQIPWYRSWGTSVIQQVLGNQTIGNFFFHRLARPKVIKKILLEAYGRPEAVTDELINLLLKPAQDVGAAAVFLAFVRYSSGPLAEELLPQLSCPTILLWGTKDPWEPLELGRKLGEIETVEQFIELDGLGHCPQDEAPEVVNPIILGWIETKI